MDSFPPAHGPVVFVFPFRIDDEAPSDVRATRRRRPRRRVRRISRYARRLATRYRWRPGATSPMITGHAAASCGLRSVAASCSAQWSNTGPEQTRMHRSVGRGELHRAHGAPARWTRRRRARLPRRALELNERLAAQEHFCHQPVPAARRADAGRGRPDRRALLWSGGGCDWWFQLAGDRGGETA